MKVAKSLAEAKRLKLPFYFTGGPCIRGHIAMRRTSSCGTCVECGKLIRKKTRQGNGRVAWLALKKRVRENNQERVKRNRRDWYVKNTAKERGYRYDRLYKETKATPAWADTARMNQLYRAAALMTAATGVEYHVDHEVPIRGKNVCGLHVETNMRVVPATVNLSKGNSYGQ